MEIIRLTSQTFFWIPAQAGIHLEGEIELRGV